MNITVPDFDSSMSFQCECGWLAEANFLLLWIISVKVWSYLHEGNLMLLLLSLTKINNHNVVSVDMICHWHFLETKQVERGECVHYKLPFKKPKTPEMPNFLLYFFCYRHNLVKKTFSGTFVFEYDLPPNENGSVPLLLDISNASPTILAFALEQITDIGGTLRVELAISPFMVSY